MLAVILPTRGTVFTKMIMALLDNLKNINYRIYACSHLPADSARNFLMKKALKDNPEYFLFIDDDVVLPSRTIKKMLAMNSGAVACEVPMKEGGSSVVYRSNGKVYWAGAGCLMVKKEEILKMEKPYFNSSPQWNIIWGKRVILKKRCDKKSPRGGEDMNFCFKMKCEIKILKGVIPHHLEIIEYADLYKGNKIISRHKIKEHICL